MPGIDLTTPIDPTLDHLSSKIQEIRERNARKSEATATDSMDSAMDVIGQNSGRQEAREASMSMHGLSMEMIQEGASAHRLDPATVADLIADPFED